MPFTCSSINSNASSTKAWRFESTPEGAPRTTHQKKPSVRTPSTAAVASESTLIDQKPPPSATGLLKKVRWCWMYSDALNSVACAIAANFYLVVAHKKCHREDQDRQHKRSQERGDDDVPVHRQHQPQQDDDEADLDALGSQRAMQNPPCRLRFAQRGNGCR